FQVAAHSRLVVYNDTLDDPTGMVHIRDLIAFMAAGAAREGPGTAAADNAKASDLKFANINLSAPLAAANIIREILYAPPSMPALLRKRSTRSAATLSPRQAMFRCAASWCQGPNRLRPRCLMQTRAGSSASRSICARTGVRQVPAIYRCAQRHRARPRRVTR